MFNMKTLPPVFTEPCSMSETVPDWGLFLIWDMDDKSSGILTWSVARNSEGPFTTVGKESTGQNFG